MHGKLRQLSRNIQSRYLLRIPSNHELRARHRQKRTGQDSSQEGPTRQMPCSTFGTTKSSRFDCGIPGTKWLIRFELTGWNDFDLSSQDSIDEQNFGRHHIIQEYGGGLAGGAVDFTLRPVSSPVVLPSAARAVSSTMLPFFNFPPQVLEPAPQVGNYAPAVTSEPAWAALLLLTFLLVVSVLVGMRLLLYLDILLGP